ncbi:type II secretion system protein J [Anopheles sinensis]|uniref:Type II secretion system protein J n=1 Tax=Anopheles sinensis TaxID=74873 RepID=A0A084VXA3_ANOSI|nr:type II secretion system protein J [Anopheles sinensis]
MKPFRAGFCQSEDCRGPVPMVPMVPANDGTVAKEIDGITRVQKIANLGEQKKVELQHCIAKEKSFHNPVFRQVPESSPPLYSSHTAPDSESSKVGGIGAADTILTPEAAKSKTIRRPVSIALRGML